VEILLRQPLERVFSSLDTGAVAAGSIAQVHRARLVSGEAVALKIHGALRAGGSRLMVALANEFCRAIRLGSGRVALLNCGMVGRLDPRPQQIVLELILAIVSLDAQRCAELTLELALPESPGGSLRDPAVSLAQLQRKYERLLQQYYTLSVAELDFSQLFSEILQAAQRNQIRWIPRCRHPLGANPPLSGLLAERAAF
jgi:predicted unusual protein kinase regulating ubiquinone biosynthesis (AarF/ABC1/UbiB family)